MKRDQDPVIYAAAAAVSTVPAPNEPPEETWHAEDVALNPYPASHRSGRSVPEAFLHIPEARDLTWEDTFFDDDDDVIAVFDFDYQQMETFYTSLGFVSLGLTLIYPPVFALACVALVPCFLQSNVEWYVRAQHVAVTPDGIRYVENRRRNCWGLACFDKGKNSKTVPFDKITDCDIIEPAGNQCICCVPRVLFTVNVDTASSNQEKHELQLAGLKDPHKFKKLVWAMKRSYSRTSNDKSQNVLQDPSLATEMLSMLREIRDELRKQNGGVQTVHAEPTVPVGPNTHF